MAGHSSSILVTHGRTPTAREVEWAVQRSRAGGSIDPRMRILISALRPDSNPGAASLRQARGGFLDRDAMRRDLYRFGRQAPELAARDAEAAAGAAPAERPPRRVGGRYAPPEPARPDAAPRLEWGYDPVAGAWGWVVKTYDSRLVGTADETWRLPPHRQDDRWEPGMLREGVRRDVRQAYGGGRTSGAPAFSVADGVRREVLRALAPAGGPSAARLDAKGGRSVRADEAGGVAGDEEEWKRVQADGSYVIRNGQKDGYVWYNKDGSLRGEARDYQEIGNGGRVFFGDMAAGTGRVTIGGDERNAADVTGFKMEAGDDGSTSFNYSTGRSQRSFTYNADGSMRTAGNVATAKYHTGASQTVSSTYDPAAHRDERGNVAPVRGASVSVELPGESVIRPLAPGMEDKAQTLREGRRGMVMEADKSRADYLERVAPKVAESLTSGLGAEYDKTVGQLREAAVREGREGVLKSEGPGSVSALRSYAERTADHMARMARPAFLGDDVSLQRFFRRDGRDLAGVAAEGLREGRNQPWTGLALTPPPRRKRRRAAGSIYDIP